MNFLNKILNKPKKFLHSESISINNVPNHLKFFNNGEKIKFIKKEFGNYGLMYLPDGYKELSTIAEYFVTPEGTIAFNTNSLSFHAQNIVQVSIPHGYEKVNLFGAINLESIIISEGLKKLKIHSSFKGELYVPDSLEELIIYPFGFSAWFDSVDCRIAITDILFQNKLWPQSEFGLGFFLYFSNIGEKRRGEPLPNQFEKVYLYNNPYFNLENGIMTQIKSSYNEAFKSIVWFSKDKKEISITDNNLDIMFSRKDTVLKIYSDNLIRLISKTLESYGSRTPDIMIEHIKGFSKVFFKGPISENIKKHLSNVSSF